MAAIVAECVCFLLLCFGEAGGGNDVREPIFIGVIEPAPIHYSGEVPATPYEVRASFQWKAGKWEAFPHEVSTLQDLNELIAIFPERVSWTIAFHGRNLGKFDTGRPAKWNFYGDIGLLLPNPSEHISLIKQGASSFLYWGNDHLPFRPLVVVSRPNFVDPDHWKPEDAPAVVVERLIPSFRKAVPVATLACASKATAHYGDGLIRGHQSFVSSAGVRLVHLALDESAVRNCDEVAQEGLEGYGSHWFYVDDKDFRYLGQSLEFIDAGDYDNDGHSEVVFHKSGYNYDGYVFLYDRLQKEVTFDWNYH